MTTTELVPVDVKTLPAPIGSQQEAALGALVSAAEAAKNAHGFVVSDPPTALRGADLMLALKNAGKALERVRADAVRPHLDAQTSINGWAKPILERLERESKRIGDTLLAWKAAEERKAQAEAAERERERREREAEAERARKAAEDASKGDDPDAALDAALKAQEASDAAQAPQVAVPMPAAATGPLRTQAGSVSTRKVWRFRVVDPALIPREYLSVDEGKIGSAVKSGTRTIPGVDVFEAEELTRR